MCLVLLSHHQAQAEFVKQGDEANAELEVLVLLKLKP